MEALLADSSFDTDTGMATKENVTTKRKTLASNNSTVQDSIDTKGRVQIRHKQGTYQDIYFDNPTTYIQNCVTCKL